MINREKYDARIYEMGRIASMYESEEFQRIIAEIQRKKDCFNVNVLFVGHFSAGKSALLNKLLDREAFLKEDQLAQTALQLNYIMVRKNWWLYHRMELKRMFQVGLR